MGNASLDPTLVVGSTVLILKDQFKACVPSNYSPITCFSVIWKFLTGILRGLLYTHWTANVLMPNQQISAETFNRLFECLVIMTLFDSLTHYLIIHCHCNKL